MHMSDSLLSPAVGGICWATTAGILGYCTHKVRSEPERSHVARMGIMGAFVFASQMINFTIPGTGSSGHLAGGLLLAIVLGPWAAYLTMASIILIQALFFADGGLLAWGANVINMGFFACFLAYPFLFKPLAGNFQNRRRVFAASIIAAVVSLQLGALGVVFQTLFSGISALPFKTFVILMQPIHLAIGIVEGLITAGVVVFLAQASPETLQLTAEPKKAMSRPWIIIAMLVVAIGGVLSWFASKNPDGLEWSIGKVTGKDELEAPISTTHGWFSQLQNKMAFLPDYSFVKSKDMQITTSSETEEESWPNIDTGTSISGIVGGIFVFLLTITWAFMLYFFRPKKSEISRE